MKSCYSGAPSTEGVGTCVAGTQICQGGVYGPCTGEVLPAAESCDGLDNDCNGQIDDGNPGSGAACVTGMPGACSAGKQACANGVVVCIPAAMPSPETCDGIDNNCDGAVDEGNPGGGAACSTSLPGPCGPGTESCQNGAFICAPVSMPQAEVCGDGVDNDCDGVVDNGCAVCGDGVIGAGEQCDDGNTADGDGCSDTCQIKVACAHNKCAAGPALDPACDSCAAQICEADASCCTDSWDDQCVGQVKSVCGITCPVCGDGTIEAGEQCDDGNTADGDGCSSTCQIQAVACAHDKCLIGAALNDDCDLCVAQICAADGFCCETAWDDVCVDEVLSICSITCGPVCGNSTVEPGEQCDDGNTADGDGCSSTCQNQAVVCVHDKCLSGAALHPNCDPCVGQICDADAFCCGTSWDNTCVGEVLSICGITCSAVCGNGIIEVGEQCDDGNTTGGDGCSDTCQNEVGMCVHDKCVTGSALDPSCDPCVGQICDADAFCCATGWDNVCVDEVLSTCGITCP